MQVVMRATAVPPSFRMPSLWIRHALFSSDEESSKRQAFRPGLPGGSRDGFPFQFDFGNSPNPSRWFPGGHARAVPTRLRQAGYFWITLVQAANCVRCSGPALQDGA